MTQFYKMMTTRKLLLAFVILLSLNAAAQKIEVRPHWEQPVKLIMGNESPSLAPSFVDAQYPDLPASILPAWSKRVTLPHGTGSVSIETDSVKYVPLTQEELSTLSNTIINDIPETRVSLMAENGKPVAVITVKPFGIDPATGMPSKVEYLGLNLKAVAAAATDTTLNIHQYAENSRMVIGDWYKLWVRQTGIHKLTFEDMKGMGMMVDGINPDRISVFGRGGAMLDESAGSGRFDDMTEISVKVVTANPGTFGPGDYVLFYAEGPVTWRQNPLTGRMDHSTHLYSDVIGYFITVANIPGKRIPVGEPVTYTANAFSTTYVATGVYENEVYNIMKSGRKWFSDKFDNYTRTLTLPDFNFPDYITSTDIQMGFGVAGKATQQMSFNILVNDVVVNNTTIGASAGENDFAKELATTQNFKTGSGNMKVKVQFNAPNNTANGWLDYVSFNVKSTLRFRGPQMNFRDPSSVGEGKVTEFTLESSQPGLEIWDVTNQAYAHRVIATQSGNAYKFKVQTPYLKEFIAFDGSSFLTPEFAGKVPNQDLHALGNYDMIIVAHPALRKQADRLAKLHNSRGEITVKVVSVYDIYNEFSSGHQDITAIRDFMKMLYDRGRTEGYPKYLLLFGNASYDFKERLVNNNNLVPTYESHNSVRPTASFLTDDYFGLLDDGEGRGPDTVLGLIDVAVGRLPVRTYEQAEQVVDKIEAYLTNKEATFGDWRNTLLIIADDEDRNTHLNQAERLCDRIEENYPLYNVDKIYFDAYRQNNTPGGGRFPDVNREINSMVDKGVLITNYIGHGGELGWADERVLEIVDINAWKNLNRVGLFFTATCEFSRFDDPQHTSAGELVFLNPEGGALAMITTTRLAFSSTNESLNLSFIDTVLKQSGQIPRMGDIIKYTKNDNSVSPNVRQLTLFGDPGLPMPMARYNVVTTSIVDPQTLSAVDTLSANGLVTINGEVRDYNGQTMSSFNGDISVKVFDKETTVRTLGQDIESFVTDFRVQKSVIYNGKAKVEGGLFSITFPVPLDIDYNFGKGKISYYATDGYTDAHGFYDDIIIGGAKDETVADETGPQIQLFVNDTTFVDGDLTSENPKLLVRLYDESGINTLGNGVGHDLTAVIDQNQYSSVLMNDFYVADVDSYQSGWAKYQYFNLDDGPHSVTVKAWDIFNNSSEATVNFVVKHDIRLDIDDVTAYPNPSNDKVWFRFKHNLFDAILNIEIEVYNSTGNLVRIINPGKVTASGYIVDEVVWDGRSDDGKILRNGLYVCRVKVLDRNGNSSAHSVKVLMAR